MTRAITLTEPKFESQMRLILGQDAPRRLAVAVSGGADSMALFLLLTRWARAQGRPMDIHVLTVDHGLRPESKAEAKQVAAWVKAVSSRESPVRERCSPFSSPLEKDSPFLLPPERDPPFSSPPERGGQGGVILHHKILTWTGPKPTTKIAETARAKRYELMAKYCAGHDIHHLFLAHHADDQAETVLLRLCAGSGVDGLAGMGRVTVDDLKQNVSSSPYPPPVSPPIPPPCKGGAGGGQINDVLYLCRPLLDVTHEMLIEFLKKSHQDWIEDPSNTNKKYARARVRSARDVLAAEGLTQGRLNRLAHRAARARIVLQRVADQAWARSVQVMHDVNAPTQKSKRRQNPTGQNQTGQKLADSKPGHLSGGGGIALTCADWDDWAVDTQVRVMTRAIETVSGHAPRMEQVEAVVEALQARASLPGTLGGPRTIRRTLAGCIVTRGTKWVKVGREAQVRAI